MLKNGFSLFELLIAIALSSFILITITALFALGHQQQLKQQGLAQQQENLRLASQILLQATQRAGYIGCYSLARHKDQPSAINQQNFLQIFNYAQRNQSQLNQTQQQRLQRDSDILEVRQGEEPVNFVTINATDKQSLTLTDQGDYEENQPVIISDCADFEMATIAQVRKNNREMTVEFVHPLTKLFHQGATVSLFTVKDFYLANSNRKDARGQAIYSLYQQSSAQNALELVEGLDKLTFVKQGQQLHMVLTIAEQLFPLTITLRNGIS